ncbi:FtsW/RodA/SpoVE family cell cycle protein [Aciduricibacillus chroicocephali]|uniref:Probable peptidoglycan glycosyltransferase FtsW n=1 Tax=Aciduricibacillus chroicocephali TaxID=3054939 RepID=A0ABY9KXQ5_9BACI|nr:FtsW/RodA/SpoVE family cell cycle protein [Bacillaceae bacterium 44XB]
MIRKLKEFDFILVFAPLLLAAFGMVMIYSSSMVTSIVEGQASTYYLMKQLQWFILGLAGMIFTSFFPYRNYQKMMKMLMLVVIVLLAGVLIFGETRNNARSWYSFGPVSLQPAEFAKLGLILYLSYIYSKKQAYIDQFAKAVVPPLVFMVFILLFIVAQPDLGTAAIILLIACTVIFSSGIRIRHLAFLGTVIGILLAVAIPFMVTDVRIARFTGAFKPFDAPDTGGYHLIQSYLAISGGGLTGTGLGQSIQKLGYLMEAHTDFIMAVIVEELGVFGLIIVFGLLALIILRGLHFARRSNDSFGSLLAIGITSMVAIQAFINLGAISGLLPITGVPLPFVSYGGSSLLVLLLSMGILNNIARSVRREEGKPMKLEIGEQHSAEKVLHNRGGKSWLKQEKSKRY